MKLAVWILGCWLVFGSVCYGEDLDIVMIKEGTLKGFETVPLGKAFDWSFDDPHWKAFQSQKGERVVEFTGKISEELHTSAAKYLATDMRLGSLSDVEEFTLYSAISRRIGFDRVEQIAKQLGREPGAATDQEMIDAVFADFLNSFWKQGTPVTVQWIIRADGEGFRLVYMESEAWEGLSFSDILTIIYW